MASLRDNNTGKFCYGSIKRSLWTCILVFLVFSLYPSSGICEDKGTVLTLSRAIEIALQQNTQIKEASYNVKASRARQRSTLFEMFPRIGAEYTYIHLRDEPYANIQMGPVVQKMPTGYTNTSSWDIYVIQPIFTGFALLSKHEIATLGLDMERLRQSQVRLDVVYEVKQAYFNVLLALKALQVRQEEVAALRAHLTDAKNFYREGLIPKNDLLKSKVAYSLSLQRLARARSDLVVAKANLNRVLNRRLDMPVEVQDITSIPPLKEGLPALIKKALRIRPAIMALNKGIKQARLYERLARSPFYPRVSLFGKYQREGSHIFATENKFSNKSNVAIGVTAKWEFFDSGKDLENVKESKYKMMALLQKKKTVEDQIALQVKKAYEDLMVAKANLSTAKNGLSQAKENFRITNEGYKVQINTSTDVLDARSYLTQAEMQYYAALYGYHISLAALYRAVGLMR